MSASANQLRLAEICEALAQLEREEKALRERQCDLNRERLRLETAIMEERPTCEG